MCSPPFSKSCMNRAHKTIFMTVYFVMILLVFSSCDAAARMGPIKVSEMEIVQTRSRSSRQYFAEGFRFKDRVFHISSKRGLVPPSGPSKRHNSVVNDLKH
ncbi:protein IDA-LIKE 1-like [Raphanus sativus]|uniref:Protein IDA-LIKE 1-like n=1 Tax=Raphanus sativus TaxID=3726 RepID=A0A6J0JRY2_RAPSA|nr:protein IDA-LIKE 1-like [Raphanus sativus]